MHGLVVIEGMTLSGHPWIINEIHSKGCLLHFVAFFHVASLFVREVENRKVGVDNKKALELTNGMVS